MAVKLKITLLFTLIMFLLLALLYVFIYYFSYASRLKNIETQLTSHARTTANMLRQPGVFDEGLMNKIDSAMVRPIKNKSIQAYNIKNEKIYFYTDAPGDTINIKDDLLREARNKRFVSFTSGKKDAVAYYDAANTDKAVIVAAAFDEDGKKHLKQLKYILLLSFTIITVIAFISGYFFSKRLLKPIRKIADEVNIISAQSLTHRLESAKSNDEWHYLTDTLNDLLNRLQESFEIQRRFISSASHELSTPLTSISGQLEVSLQRNRSAEEYREVMQSVYQDARHLSKLTQTLLQFATVSGTVGGIDIKLIRIDEVLMQLPGEVLKMDKGYSVNLEFIQIPALEEKLLVFGNADLLFTAIKNIVSNACKYSPNKLAKVKLSINQTEIIVSIEDEGKGISEAELKNIFQPFYRTEDSRAIVGFGVGLPLVNRIIKLHKGQIKVISTVGKGTTFFVHLPIAGNLSKAYS
jgi:two-component system, OmpR family, sensor histidine kinase ArlS